MTKTSEGHDATLTQEQATALPASGMNPNKPDVFDRLSPAQINSLTLLAAGERAKEVAAKVDVTPKRSVCG